MIDLHEFDSAWRGQPIGIVSDTALFGLSRSHIAELCEAYEWVEFRSPASAPVPIGSLASSGFIKLDTQVNFRLDLIKFSPKPVPGLKTITSAERAIEPDLSVARPFEHERFATLPGVDYGSVNRRYTVWARKLCREAPEWCVAVEHEGRIQGWYFSQPTAGGELNLTLGASSRDAEVSGTDIYRAAFARYFEAGASIGSASFSVKNMAAMNIYSSFGARFTGAIDFWIRSPKWAP